MTTLQKAGLGVMLLSLVVGIVGTVWSIYLSFTALDSAEVSGLGAVSDRVASAIIFTAGGLVGSGIGLALFIAGRPRSDGD